MELLDLEADRGPARRDELDRTVERVSDSAQRARPMLANMVGEVRGALNRQNGVGNLGTGRSSEALDFVSWRPSTIHQRSPMRLKLVPRLSSTKFWSRIGAWARRATMSPFRIMVARQYRRRRRFRRAVRIRPRPASTRRSLVTMRSKRGFGLASRSRSQAISRSQLQSCLGARSDPTRASLNRVWAIVTELHWGST